MFFFHCLVSKYVKNAWTVYAGGHLLLLFFQKRTREVWVWNTRSVRNWRVSEHRRRKGEFLGMLLNYVLKEFVPNKNSHLWFLCSLKVNDKFLVRILYLKQFLLIPQIHFFKYHRSVYYYFPLIYHGCCFYIVLLAHWSGLGFPWTFLFVLNMYTCWYINKDNWNMYLYI